MSRCLLEGKNELSAFVIGENIARFEGEGKSVMS
jgi:hypothetical protein